MSKNVFKFKPVAAGNKDSRGFIAKILNIFWVSALKNESFLRMFAFAA